MLTRDKNWHFCLFTSFVSLTFANYKSYSTPGVENDASVRSPNLCLALYVLVLWSPNLTVLCRFPVDHLCHFSLKSVHWFSRYRAHNFGRRRTLRTSCLCLGLPLRPGGRQSIYGKSARIVLASTNYLSWISARKCSLSGQRCART